MDSTGNDPLKVRDENSTGLDLDIAVPPQGLATGREALHRAVAAAAARERYERKCTFTQIHISCNHYCLCHVWIYIMCTESPEGTSVTDTRLKQRIYCAPDASQLEVYT